MAYRNKWKRKKRAPRIIRSRPMIAYLKGGKKILLSSNMLRRPDVRVTQKYVFIGGAKHRRALVTPKKYAEKLYAELPEVKRKTKTHGKHTTMTGARKRRKTPPRVAKTREAMLKRTISRGSKNGRLLTKGRVEFKKKGRTTTYTAPPAESILRPIIIELEKGTGFAKLPNIIGQAESRGMSQKEVKQTIAKLRRNGEIYEPRPGSYKIV